MKFVKQSKKYFKAQSDSMIRAASIRNKAMKKKPLSVRGHFEIKIYKPWAKRLARDNMEWLSSHHINLSLTSATMYRAYLEWYYLRAAHHDSLLFLLRQRNPKLRLPKQLSNRLETYQIVNADRLSSLKPKVGGIGLGNKLLDAKPPIGKYGTDFAKYQELTNADAAKDQAVAQGESLAKSKLQDVKEIQSLKGQLSEASSLSGYRDQATKLQDSAYLKEEAKKRAQAAAVQYMSDNPGAMQTVQNKMKLLMKKYSIVPNSNDLSTAIKRNSLVGKPLRQRIYLAANFQVLSFKPFVIDLSPTAGYRLNARLVAGVGGTYRQTFSDTLPRLSPDVFGYKTFVNYDIFYNLFTVAEFARNSPGTDIHEGKSTRLWENAALAGVGRKFMISARIETTILLMYNFTHGAGDKVYTSPWVVRVGLQGSPLAFLRK